MESIKDLVDRLNGENYSRVERSPLSQRRGGGEDVALPLHIKVTVMLGDARCLA